MFCVFEMDDVPRLLNNMVANIGAHSGIKNVIQGLNDINGVNVLGNGLVIVHPMEYCAQENDVDFSVITEEHEHNNAMNTGNARNTATSANNNEKLNKLKAFDSDKKSIPELKAIIKVKGKLKEKFFKAKVTKNDSKKDDTKNAENKFGN